MALVISGPEVIPPRTLTYAASVTTDASTGAHFRITLAGDLFLADPVNPHDGQKVLWELIQDATGGRLLTLGPSFNAGPLAPISLSAESNRRDFMGAVYNAGTATWDVIAFLEGY